MFLMVFVTIQCAYGQENGFICKNLMPHEDKNGNWGYVDSVGRERISHIYAQCSSFYGGVARVKNREGKIALIDMFGNHKTLFKYDQLYIGESSFLPVLIRKKGEQTGGMKDCWGYLNRKGEEVVPCLYKYVPVDASILEGDLLLCQKFDGRWGAYDTLGGVLFPFEYDFITDVSGGFYWISKNDTSFVRTKECSWNFSVSQYAEVGPFDKGCSVVYKIEDWENCKLKFGVIDTTGKEIYPCIYDEEISVMNLLGRDWMSFPVSCTREHEDDIITDDKEK